MRRCLFVLGIAILALGSCAGLGLAQPCPSGQCPTGPCPPGSAPGGCQAGQCLVGPGQCQFEYRQIPPPCDPCNYYPNDCCYWSGIDPPWCWGRWYGTAEALVNWQRDVQSNRVAVIQVTDEATSAPATPLFNVNSLDFNSQTGVRTTIGRRIDDFRGFEATYFGFFNWQATDTVVGANNLALPDTLGTGSADFFAADSMTLTYQSRLHNGELNWIQNYGDFQVLGGMRYISLVENLDIQAIDTTGTGNYRINANNNLYGGQYGVRYARNHDWFGYDFTVKLGLFGNDARQTQSISDPNPTTFLRSEVGAHAAQVAFVGDVNLSGMVRLTNVWSLRAGYSCILMEGIALAPDQLDFTNTAGSGNSINTQGGMFLHGLNVGIHAAW